MKKNAENNEEIKRICTNNSISFSSMILSDFLRRMKKMLARPSAEANQYPKPNTAYAEC